MRQLQVVRDQLQELRYLDADVSGWQAYLYMHAIVEGGAQATDPAGDTVQGIMADKAAGTELLAGLSKLDVAPAEKATLQKTADAVGCLLRLHRQDDRGAAQGHAGRHQALPTRCSAPVTSTRSGRSC